MFSNKEIKERVIIRHNKEKGVCAAIIPQEDVVDMVCRDYEYLIDVLGMGHDYYLPISIAIRGLLKGKSLVAVAKCHSELEPEYIEAVGEDIAKARIVKKFKKLEKEFLFCMHDDLISATSVVVDGIMRAEHGCRVADKHFERIIEKYK